ncbi:MAG: DUF488 domain-containing protein [Candidatus Stahlbacteria bacterium]|nr:MAG: DUF488 domain-containing protein [Candidatus Stahlbacteria bacterium]
MRIYTLGTENRSEAEIAKILSKYQIHVLADIRRSTASPVKHLRRENIQNICKNNKVEYIYLGNELGSERETGRVDNLDPAFYERGIAIFKRLARTRGLLILCSERTPERCNRRLIAAELAKDGAEVFHLLELEKLWRPTRKKAGVYGKRPSKRKRSQGDRGRKDHRRGRSKSSEPGKERPLLKKKTSRSKMDKIS